MKKIYPIICLLCRVVMIITLSGCSMNYEAGEASLPVEAEDYLEDREYDIPDAPVAVQIEVSSYSANTRWAVATHNTITGVCARQWGLSPARRAVMEKASEMPDTYQASIDKNYSQPWSHAYIYHSLGFWVWGDADDDFHDNLDGDSGESESPEGYKKKWAGYYYKRKNQRKGDWYVGYACHYIEDVSLVLHNTIPNLDMLLHHFDFEKWVQNNLNEGHAFLEDVKRDRSYYVISDPKAGIRSAAWNTSWGNKNGVGKTAWNAYKASGYPTGTGTGNSELIAKTRIMIREAGRYTRGAIKYALDTYGQWKDEY